MDRVSRPLTAYRIQGLKETFLVKSSVQLIPGAYFVIAGIRPFEQTLFSAIRGPGISCEYLDYRMRFLFDQIEINRSCSCF